MFKGIDEQTKKEFEKLGDPSSDHYNYFAFSYSDLELVERNGKRKKCRLLSDELSNKLHQIYSRGKSDYVLPIKFIDFEPWYGVVGAFSGDGADYFRWYILIKKDIQKNSEVLPDGTLKFNFILRGRGGNVLLQPELDEALINKKNEF